MTAIWNTEEKYGSISKWLHWTIAVLVVVQLATVGLAFLLQDTSYKSMIGFLIGSVHKPNGVLLLILTVISLMWYASSKHPKFPENMPLWQRAAARITHLLLYLGLIGMSLSGILMSAAAGRPAQFLFWKNITLGFPIDPIMANQFLNVHILTAWLLIALVLIHVLAAIQHHVVKKDNILIRMLRDQ